MTLLFLVDPITVLITLSDVSVRLLQPHLSPKERQGAYLAGWIRRCAPESTLSDLSDLSDPTPEVLHRVIESLKIKLEREKEKMADVPF